MLRQARRHKPMLRRHAQVWHIPVTTMLCRALRSCPAIGSKTFTSDTFGHLAPTTSALHCIDLWKRHCMPTSLPLAATFRSSRFFPPRLLRKHCAGREKRAVPCRGVTCVVGFSDDTRRA
jgi:hypothetical protein